MMDLNTKTQKRKPFGAVRGQAMVEFAIALPILMALLIGIIEVSRLVFMYAMVINSSRDAVRYASAYGKSDDGYLKYSYCYGIRDTAKKSGFFLGLSNSDIKITYDSGPGTSPKVTEVSTDNACDATSGQDPDVVDKIDSGNRVTVTVSKTYRPIVNLLPFGQRTITAKSSRTVLGVFDLDE